MDKVGISCLYKEVSVFELGSCNELGSCKGNRFWCWVSWNFRETKSVQSVVGNYG